MNREQEKDRFLLQYCTGTLECEQCKSLDCLKITGKKIWTWLEVLDILIERGVINDS